LFGSEELAEKLEPRAQSIRNWVAQADRDDGHRQDGLTTDEREEEDEPRARRLLHQVVVVVALVVVVVVVPGTSMRV